jgi:hypothetical protein
MEKIPPMTKGFSSALVGVTFRTNNAARTTATNPRDALAFIDTSLVTAASFKLEAVSCQPLAKNPFLH